MDLSFLHPRRNVHVMASDAAPAALSLPRRYPSMDTSYAAAQVFDHSRFLANVDGNLDLMHEIAQLFLEDCPRRLAALHDAMVRRDCAALEQAAHTLKGSAGYISAPGVFSAADAVETIARCGDLTAADDACARLQQATRQLVQALAGLR